jgi:hypothetical protein
MFFDLFGVLNTGDYDASCEVVTGCANGYNQTSLYLTIVTVSLGSQPAVHSEGGKRDRLTDSQ